MLDNKSSNAELEAVNNFSVKEYNTQTIPNNQSIQPNISDLKDQN